MNRRLLLIRHAIAESRIVFARTGKNDDLRPLTARGRKKMKKCAEGIHSLAPSVALFAASPLVRAQQTLQILLKKYEKSSRPTPNATIDELKPGMGFEPLIKWLGKNLPAGKQVALVGHEPHLSQFAAFLLTGQDRTVFTLKKGGACLISFEGRARGGRGQLEWLLEPSELRRIRN